jgi:hypothetical protein
MIAHLVGIAKIDFVNDTGETVTGTSLHVNLDDPNVSGLAAVKLFVGKNITLPANLAPGCDLDIQFNQRGKIVTVSAAPAKFGSIATPK